MAFLHVQGPLCVLDGAKSILEMMVGQLASVQKLKDTEQTLRLISLRGSNAWGPRPASVSCRYALPTGILTLIRKV